MKTKLWRFKVGQKVAFLSVEGNRLIPVTIIDLRNDMGIPGYIAKNEFNESGFFWEDDLIEILKVVA